MIHVFYGHNTRILGRDSTWVKGSNSSYFNTSNNDICPCSICNVLSIRRNTDFCRTTSLCVRIREECLLYLLLLPFRSFLLISKPIDIVESNMTRKTVQDETPVFSEWWKIICKQVDSSVERNMYPFSFTMLWLSKMASFHWTFTNSTCRQKKNPFYPILRLHCIIHLQNQTIFIQFLSLHSF